MQKQIYSLWSQQLFCGNVIHPRQARNASKSVSPRFSSSPDRSFAWSKMKSWIIYITCFRLTFRSSMLWLQTKKLKLEDTRRLYHAIPKKTSVVRRSVRRPRVWRRRLHQASKRMARLTGTSTIFFRARANAPRLTSIWCASMPTFFKLSSCSERFCSLSQMCTLSMSPAIRLRFTACHSEVRTSRWATSTWCLAP